MAPVNGIPFLDYQLNYLKHYGVKNVVISTGHLADKISDHYGNSFQGLELAYSYEDSPLGTGGGIRKAIEKCYDEVVLVLNGDSFFDVNIENFCNLHLEQKSQISLALRKVSDASRYGKIEVGEANRIVSFKEKSSVSEPGLINGGVYILDKNLYLRNTNGVSPFSIERDFFTNQLESLVIKGFEFNGYFIDIGIPEDYSRAQHEFKGFKYK
jgi:D-glycero-alpha-D-manno-heptose 1-phosphate guanylyltransferase